MMGYLLDALQSAFISFGFYLVVTYVAGKVQAEIQRRRDRSETENHRVILEAIGYEFVPRDGSWYVNCPDGSYFAGGCENLSEAVMTGWMHLEFERDWKNDF
jgi:hypothetical protein